VEVYELFGFLWGRGVADGFLIIIENNKLFLPLLANSPYKAFGLLEHPPLHLNASWRSSLLKVA